MVVSNGSFMVTLDFGGGIFNGAARWLELAVSTNAADNYSVLTLQRPGEVARPVSPTD